MAVGVKTTRVKTKTTSIKADALARLDSWLYKALYFMCHNVGVLPVFRTPHVNPSSHPQQHLKACFSTNANAKLITVGQLCVCALFAYHQTPVSFSRSYLLTFLWCVNTSSTLSSVLVPLLTSHRLARCLSSACKIYSLPSKHVMRMSPFLFLIMVTSPFLAILFTLGYFTVIPVWDLLPHVQYNYMHVPVGAVEVLISTLCFISQRAYFDINSQLVYFYKLRGNLNTFTCLRDLLENHLAVDRFVSDFADYFGIHFLNIFLSFTLRSIVYAAFFVQASKRNRTAELVVFAVHVVYLTVRLCLVCYRCEKLKEQAAKTSYMVRRIRLLWLDDLTEDQAQLVDTYEELMETGAVTFSACGLFSINMLQVINVLGLVVTYGLVALQSK